MTFGGEMERIGCHGKEAVGGRGRCSATRRIPVGVVVGGYAARGMHADIHGETLHAGPTPMDRRKNALIGAAVLAAYGMCGGLRN